MWSILQDVRSGLRQMKRNPGFTAATVFCLATGFAAATSVFSLVRAVTDRPGIGVPDELVAISGSRKGYGYDRSSLPDYMEIESRCDAFSGVFARSYWPVSVKGTGEAKVVLGNLVTARYFEVLKVRLLEGRGFLPSEAAAGSQAAVAVISERLARRMFGAGGGLGKTIHVSKNALAVIGVAPPGFQGEMSGFAVDVWMPVALANRVLPVEIPLTERGYGWLDVGARLRPGASLGQAQANLTSLSKELEREHPATYRDRLFVARDGLTSMFPDVGMARGVQLLLSILGLVVCGVLLIACFNAAGLQLVRGASRQQELASRMALGASRARLLRQLFVEGLMLSLAAAAAGLLAAAWITSAFGQVRAPTPIPVELNPQLGAKSFLFALILAALATVMFTAIPALRVTGRPLTALLKDGRAKGLGLGRARTQAVMVTLQVTLCLILGAGAGLTLRSLMRVLETDPGFRVENSIIAALNLSYGRYTEAESRRFYRDLVSKVEGIPGVSSASIAVIAPVNFMKQNATVRKPDGAELIIDFNSVPPRYFETMGIPILAGRPIDERDVEGSAPVAVVNQTMARLLWGGADPVGRAFGRPGREMTVVGVARDGKYFYIGERQQPYFYVPLAQLHASFSTLHVRTHSDPRALLARVRETIQHLDPNLPPPIVNTIEDQMRITQYPARITAATVTAFAVMALILALAGVFGLVSYAASQRTHEFGMRMALGACERQILWQALSQGCIVCLAGAALGLPGAYAIAKMMSGLLFGVSATDPLVFLITPVIVFGAILAACYVPARRAAHLDPARALRYE